MKPPLIALDAEQRERLVDEFRGALECAARQHESSAAVASEVAAEAPVTVDLATLLSEMAVLKNEVRLQSRQFKSALDEMRTFGNDLRLHGERLQRDLDAARERAVSIRAQTERQFLLALLDLRDRLQSGVDAAARPPSSFLGRLLPGPARFAASLAQGQQLTLQRLDDLLASHRVHALPVLGEILDPQRMRAVGVEDVGDSAGIPNGTVRREVRRGFLHNGELLRVAEVIVSKKATRI